MSWWTYIDGIITVCPMGRTQLEKRYILETVLAHLPRVTDTKRDMNVYIIQKAGESSSCSRDEFGESTNNLTDINGHKSYSGGLLRTQDEYILVVEGKLRDRMFNETLKAFQKWLCRLAKRIRIENVMVEISGYEKSFVIRNHNDTYGKMFETPSWSASNINGEVNWCEYLMWDHARGSFYPLLLNYKYFDNDDNEENSQEARRRIDYQIG